MDEMLGEVLPKIARDVSPFVADGTFSEVESGYESVIALVRMCVAGSDSCTTDIKIFNVSSSAEMLASVADQVQDVVIAEGFDPFEHRRGLLCFAVPSRPIEQFTLHRRRRSRR